MTDQHQDEQHAPPPPFPPPEREPEPGAAQIDAGAQKLPEPTGPGSDEPEPGPEGLTLIERIELLETNVEALLAGGGSGDAGLSEAVKAHVDAEVNKIRTEVSNITAKVGRAVGIDLQA